jgi:hypothetical protein
VCEPQGAIASGHYTLLGIHAHELNHMFGTERTAMWMTSKMAYRKPENKMLYTLAVVLIILWLLGVTTSFVAGGLIHILLVIAIIAILVRVISGRKAL